MMEQHRSPDLTEAQKNGYISGLESAQKMITSMGRSRPYEIAEVLGAMIIILRDEPKENDYFTS